MTKRVKIQSCCHMPPFVTSLKPVLKDIKIPYIVKKKAQAISNAFEGEVSVNVPTLYEVPNLTIQTSAVSAFNRCHQPL